MTATDCDVEIRFGSYAAGIDRSAAAGVEELLRSDPGVAGVTRSAAGIEGEHRLCVHTRSPEAASRLFDLLVQRIAGPVSAPVTVSGPQGSYTAPTAAHRS